LSLVWVYTLRKAAPGADLLVPWPVMQWWRGR
jgi:hypothetical protein